MYSCGWYNFYQIKTRFTKNLLTTFNSVEYGTGVHKLKDDGIKKLNMDQMRIKMVLVTITRSECVKAVTDVHIINTCLQDINPIFKPSGIVVLMMTMKGYKLKSDKNKLIQWAQIIIEMCKHCKNNILDSNMVSHHDSLSHI